MARELINPDLDNSDIGIGVWFVMKKGKTKPDKLKPKKKGTSRKEVTLKDGREAWKDFRAEIKDQEYLDTLQASIQAGDLDLITTETIKTLMPDEVLDPVDPASEAEV